MIIDHISNRAQYYCLGGDYRTALDFFAGVGSEPLTKTDIPLDHGRVLIKVRPMRSKAEENCSFEAHREYADIHFLAYGTEQIGYADAASLKEVSYNPQSDAAALEGKGDKVTLRPGYFMITMPQDAHMPCIAPREPAPIGKMIAKIHLSSQTER